MLAKAATLVACLIAVALPDAALRASVPPALASVAGEVQARPAASPASSGGLDSTAPATDTSPIRLLIPRIGVNAAIEARGLDAGRNMETPNDYREVAWYELGPRPGAAGNALINGHVDWWTGSAVFTRLRELRSGDAVIVVRGDGTRVTFKVTGRSTVAANARIASLFAPSRVASLTLITCAGVWDPLSFSNTQRLLVSTVLA